MKKYCINCGKELRRKRYKRSERSRGWSWEKEKVFNKRKFCNRKCANSGVNNPMFGVDRKKSWNWYLENGKYIKFHQCSEWKAKARSIYKRDNFTCQEYLRTIKELRVLGLNIHCHHIIEKSKGGSLFDDNNLVTLCEICHGLKHENISLFKVNALQECTKK